MFSLVGLIGFLGPLLNVSCLMRVSCLKNVPMVVPAMLFLSNSHTFPSHVVGLSLFFYPHRHWPFVILPQVL